MTKRKTGVFRGAWMNSNIPDRIVRGRLAAHRKENLDPEPVLVALRGQMELRRFEIDRQAMEPEPAQWRGLIAAIQITDVPDYKELDKLRRQIGGLPLHVLAVLNAELFKRSEIGQVELFRRMMQAAAIRGGVADANDVALLRNVLADMAESLQYVKGRRGPKYDVAPALRAVHQAIIENSSMDHVSARALAADLLNDCGIKAPTSRSQLAKLLAK